MIYAVINKKNKKIVHKPCISENIVYIIVDGYKNRNKIKITVLPKFNFDNCKKSKSKMEVHTYDWYS